MIIVLTGNGFFVKLHQAEQMHTAGFQFQKGNKNKNKKRKRTTIEAVFQITVNRQNKESEAQNAKSKVFASLLPSFAKHLSSSLSWIILSMCSDMPEAWRIFANVQ